MASAKESPRQKMIGMMYLVLTALLALNVSKEILNAFVIVNTSLENTNRNFQEKNEALYASFDLAKSIDPARITSSWNKALEIKKRSAYVFSYMDSIKKILIQKTEDVEKQIADTLSLGSVEAKDNYDIPTNLMIGEVEDGSKGISRTLKNTLKEYKDFLTQVIEPEDREHVKLDINTDDTKNNSNENWELNNFYHTPLAACVTILSKLQTDVKNAENAVVDYLLKKMDADLIKFDTIAARVIPQNNYVLLGEKYKADVFLAAFSKTQDPEILVGESQESLMDTVPVEKGQGKYETGALREGIVKWYGKISIKSPRGKTLSYPFASEYIVARPALTVSADKMNVMYAGVVNPISVSVPGIPTEKLRVSINKGMTLIRSGKGKYEVSGLSHNTGNVEVSVLAEMENGETRNMGAIAFRVKPLPPPIPKVASKTGEFKISKSLLLAHPKVTADYEKFDFEASCNVISFDMSIKVNGVYIPFSSGNENFTEAMKKTILQVRRNTVIYIENIWAMGPDSLKRKLPPIKIVVE